MQVESALAEEYDELRQQFPLSSLDLFSSVFRPVEQQDNTPDHPAML